jgi:hypothetical protein
VTEVKWLRGVIAAAANDHGNNERKDFPPDCVRGRRHLGGCSCFFACNPAAKVGSPTCDQSGAKHAARWSESLPKQIGKPDCASGAATGRTVRRRFERSAGQTLVGSAIWRIETVSPGAGLAPELVVRADVKIPDRRMSVTWSLRRNTDKTLPASHTIEIMFSLPADFPGGGIASAPGVLMKQTEKARGTPLAGLSVKVTNGFFLIGLSGIDSDQQRNVQLLKDLQWFDLPIVYTNGSRAIIAVEKGTSGDRAFANAFAAWGK